VKVSKTFQLDERGDFRVFLLQFDDDTLMMIF